jgi:hypothetical protein
MAQLRAARRAVVHRRWAAHLQVVLRREALHTTAHLKMVHQVNFETACRRTDRVGLVARVAILKSPLCVGEPSSAFLRF